MNTNNAPTVEPQPKAVSPGVVQEAPKSKVIVPFRNGSRRTLNTEEEFLAEKAKYRSVPGQGVIHVEDEASAAEIGMIVDAHFHRIAREGEMLVEFIRKYPKLESRLGPKGLEDFRKIISLITAKYPMDLQ